MLSKYEKIPQKAAALPMDRRIPKIKLSSNRDSRKLNCYFAQFANTRSGKC